MTTIGFRKKMQSVTIVGGWCLIMASLFMGNIPVALAQNVSVEATVDENIIELGSSVQLTVTVAGVQSLAPVQLPDIDGFQTRYLGPSTRISIINGSYSSSVAFMYALFPSRVGRFVIPALPVTVNGKDYLTKPISIEVADSGSSGSSTATAGQSAASQQSSAPASLADKIFIVMRTPKQTVYLNEKITLKILLLVNGVSVRNVQMPEFEHDGFVTGDYAKPEQYRKVLNGIDYQVVEFTTDVYPARAGVLTLGPARAVCQVLYRSQSSHRSTHDFDSFFNDDFFNSFFGNYDVQPLKLESQPLSLSVLPLPEQGKPNDFNGAVGSFSMEMTASPQEVKVGDPVTVRMRISGEGNLQSVNLAGLDDAPGIKDNFKVYDPQVTEKDGTKILEQVLIPKADKVKEVPAKSFSYFDPEKQQYQTITKGPFELKVIPEDNAPAKVAGLPAAAPGENSSLEELGQDIVFIKKSPGRWQSMDSVSEQNRFFGGLFATLFIAWMAIFVHYLIRQRFKTDERFARRFQAPRQARQGLALAARHLDKSEAKEFYDTVFKTLQDYFSDKFHLPAGTVTLEALADLGGEKIKNNGIFDKLKDVWNECEVMRYAFLVADKTRMSSCLYYLKVVIDYFERR